MYYAEHTQTNKHGLPCKLLPIEGFGGLTGFTTVYMFNEEVASWLRNNKHPHKNITGSFAGLVAARHPVATDTLIADFDGQREAAVEFIHKLEDWGVGFSVWDSGGDKDVTGIKSSRLHVVVDAVFKEDWRVPSSQLAFMEQHARGFDPTVYRATSLIRLPGTVHDKTGHQKQLVWKAEGHALDYDLVSPDAQPHAKQAPQDRREALSVLWRLALTWPEEGGRRFHVYKLCSSGIAAGLDCDSLLDVCKYWNNRLPAPLAESQLTEKFWESL